MIPILISCRVVGEDVQSRTSRVGIHPDEQVDAANARLEFSSGAVANITASRVGTEKIRKMRFFQRMTSGR